MQNRNLIEVSSTRLPADHFLSGALLGGITTLAYDLNHNLKPRQIALNLVKNSISGGIAGATAINAANSIVQKRYFEASLSVALGVAGVILTQKLIK